MTQELKRSYLEINSIEHLEEVDELIEAIEEDTNKIHEAADVLYHILMYLEANDVKIEEVMQELDKRKK